MGEGRGEEVGSRVVGGEALQLSTPPVTCPDRAHNSTSEPIRESRRKTARLLFLPFQAIGSFTNNRDLLLGPSAASIRSKGKPQAWPMSPSRWLVANGP